MNASIDITNKIKVAKMELIQGEYEGYQYYKIKAVLDNNMILTNKLTAFEYETLKKLYSSH